LVLAIRCHARSTSPGLKDEITKTEEEMVKAAEEYARIAAEVRL